jgi:hypothetical protein
MALRPNAGHGLLILEASRSHTHTHNDAPQSVGLLWTCDQLIAQRPLPDNTNTHNRQTSIPPVGFEPTIPAGERLQTHALDRAATGTSNLYT